MNKLRFRYSKTGRAKYISHLDLTSTMQRAFLRAGFKLKYSEGFNPHPYISVALPLSVGCESVCELMDVGMIDGTVPDIDSIFLPDGINILDIYIPERKFSEIAWIDIIGKLHYDVPVSNIITENIMQRFSEKSIIISKKTKRGLNELDIAPYIKDFEVLNNDNVYIKMKTSAQNPSINKTDIESVLENGSKPEFIDIKRIGIYDSDMLLFK